MNFIVWYIEFRPGVYSLNSDKLIIIGGDERRIYMEEYLNSIGYETVVYEEDPQNALNEMQKRNITTILPLPFTRDGENINIKLSDVSLRIDDFISLLKKGDKVFAGMIKDTVVERLNDKGVNVYDYYDEDLIVKNAFLTAIGLKQVMEENKIDIKSGPSAVIGFGRTAKAISEMLNVNSAEFTVYARNKDVINLAESMNYDAVNLKYFTEECTNFSVIINTVPAVIIDENILKRLKHDTVIIDIASYPYGVDINIAAEHSIKVIRALSLPGKYTPDLAGTLIGEKIKRFL